MTLWDSKDTCVTRIFKNNPKEELISWLNSKGELWRSIKNFEGNFEAKREYSITSIKYIDSKL
jgi:hypothetical protein